MNKYEVLLYETQLNTLLYEVEARGEKEAIRIALREHMIEDPKEEWVTSRKTEGEKVYLIVNDTKEKAQENE
jgi:hypothetical protein